MKKTALFLFFALLTTNSAFAQVERDDASQVATEYANFAGAVAGECSDALIKISTHFEIHGEQSLKIDVINVKEVRLTIFDRKGTKLYEGTLSVLYNAQTDIKDGKHCKTIDTGWNGRYQNQLLAPDTYVYAVNGLCIDDKKMKGSGRILLKHE